MSLYENMSRHSDSFPSHIPYIDGLPLCLRRPIYDLLETTPDVNTRGQVLSKPLFEQIRKSILNRDFGDVKYGEAENRDPEIAANRCLALKTLINVCKCSIFVDFVHFCSSMDRVCRRFHQFKF